MIASFRYAFLLAALFIGSACSGSEHARDVAPATEAAESVAVARMSAHFATAQGFSADSLRARETWFTDSLFRLLSADLGHGTSIGALAWDPFTAAQDSASAFAHTSARATDDTVLVDFAISFDSSFAPGTASGVTLAMRFERDAWRIADFITDGRSLATAIRTSLTSPTP